MLQQGLLCEINGKISIIPIAEGKDVFFITIPVIESDLSIARDFLHHEITKVHFTLTEVQTLSGFVTYAKLIIPEGE